MAADEARVLIDTLARCGTREHLAVLLDSGQVPGSDGNEAGDG